MTLYTITEISIYDALDLLEKQPDIATRRQVKTKFHHGDGSVVRCESEEVDDYASSIAYWRYLDDESEQQRRELLNAE